MPHEDIYYEIEELERALNILDPQTRREATRTYAGDCVLFNAKLQEACGIVAANGRQVTKALRRAGFSDFKSFLEAFSQVKRERDAAVAAEKNDALTLEELRAMDGEPVFVTTSRLYAGGITKYFRQWMLVDVREGEYVEEIFLVNRYRDRWKPDDPDVVDIRRRPREEEHNG